MDDTKDIKQTNSDINAEDITKEGKSTEQSVKTFTQEEIDKMISVRLEREQKKFSERLEKEKTEAERMAKLTADEREKEILKQSKNELEEKERLLKLRENQLTAYNKLAEAGLDNSFVDFVLDEDSEKMLEKIENLKTRFTKSLEEKLKKEMEGKPPKDVSSPNPAMTNHSTAI